MAGDPLAMYLVDLYTVSANLAGIPGLCLPCGQSKSGLPIGLQLQAAALRKKDCFAAHGCTSRRPIGTSSGRHFEFEAE